MSEQGNEPVALHLSGSARLPQTIILPMKIVAHYDVPRRFNISDREQIVPRAIKDWMQAQPRYAGLFASGQPDVAQDAGEIAEKAPAKARKPAKAQTEPEAAKVQLPPPDAVKQPEPPQGEDDEQTAGDEEDAADTATGSPDNTPTFVAEPYPHPAWSRQWNVVSLRAYAKDNGVELLNHDKRDDVIAKLTASGLPDQDTGNENASAGGQENASADA